MPVGRGRRPGGCACARTTDLKRSCPARNRSYFSRFRSCWAALRWGSSLTAVWISARARRNSLALRRARGGVRDRRGVRVLSDRALAAPGPLRREVVEGGTGRRRLRIVREQRAVAGGVVRL